MFAHLAPGGLWLDEVLPAYAAGLQPEVAVDRILARRDTRSVFGTRQRQRRGWREWDFWRALRRTGRA